MTPEAANSHKQQLRAELLAEEVDVDLLAVVMANGEHIYGELVQENHVPVYNVRVRNPKRLVRLQHPSQGNFRIDFLLVDYDLISGGEMQLIPNGLYFIKSLDEASQLSMLSLYRQYLENRKLSRAAAAGIVVPKMQPPPSPPHNGS